MRNVQRAVLCLLVFGPFPAWVQAAEIDNQADSIDLWHLYQESVHSDPRLQGAEAQVRTGEGQERASFGQLLPQLSAGASSSRVRREEAFQNQRYNGENYSLSLSQALYNPAAWRGFKRYSQLTQQYRAQYDDAKTQSAADLVQRYFAALAADDGLDLIIAQRIATQRSLDRMQALFDRHMSTITDVLQLSAKVDSLKTQEIEARNQTVVARESLAELVGRSVYQSLKRLDEKAPLAMPQGTEEQWVGLAVSRNPALQSKQHAVEAANSGIAEAKAGHLPTLSFNLGAQRSDFVYDNVLASSAINTYSATISLQIPLYSGGSTAARVASSYGSRDSAEQDYEAIRRQVIKETRMAYLRSRADLAKIASSRYALESAVKSREASERALSLGVATAVDVLNAVQQEYSAKRDYLQARYDFITNQLVLLRWSGGFEDIDVQRINGWLSVSHPDDKSGQKATGKG
ncbi:TolC family outer membrane protein [Pseudomonas sp. EpS/L25]|uniref:TolC family outer membrane protein n=1 Tax=Pseudomonas sp. EpS/L25 TaxID=1749078 RepID=UPI0009EAFC43|nr:TolC family outer membrane protein [Pseudomonas sp. EpS/L25]